MDMQNLLKRHKSNLALVIGNGINRYDNAANNNSWENLLWELSKKYLNSRKSEIPEGITPTEFYDVLELKANSSILGENLQQNFCDLMSDWTPHDHHRWIAKWAVTHNIPILTTNFEKTLGDAVDCDLHHITTNGFTDFYPWKSYYGRTALKNPCDGFGVWHINGMERYHRSIRLGLSHYMGCVEKARGWLHKGKERRLFFGKNAADWPGKDTWLHVIFNKPLLIFGLGLKENEVFLRWLLIERARYFMKFPDRKRSAWYVHTPDDKDTGKLFFLKGVGVTPVLAGSYDEIYGGATWN